MKVTIEFEDEDRQQAEHCFNGERYYFAIEDFRNFLRNKLKHGDYEGEALEVLEEINREFYQSMEGILQ
jgi:hypothetical protein